MHMRTDIYLDLIFFYTSKHCFFFFLPIENEMCWPLKVKCLPCLINDTSPIYLQVDFISIHVKVTMLPKLVFFSSLRSVSSYQRVLHEKENAFINQHCSYTNICWFCLHLDSPVCCSQTDQEQSGCRLLRTFVACLGTDLYDLFVVISDRRERLSIRSCQLELISQTHPLPF